MKRKKNWLSQKRMSWLALMVCLLLVFCQAPRIFADESVQETMKGATVILHTNDTHGRVNDNMGFAAVAALKKEYEAKGATVLVLDAGDTLHGKPIVTLNKGENAVTIMNAVGYDAMAIGNHDLNYGVDQLKVLEKQMNFPLLAANVTVKKTGRPLAGTHIVIERDGKRYGIFGLTTPEAAYMTNPTLVEGLDFGDPIATAKRETEALHAEGVDMVIGLFHIGLNPATKITSADIAKAVPGIDVIIDGHSHTLLEKGMTVGETFIASDGEYLEHIGVVTILADGTKSAAVVGKEYAGRDPEVMALIQRLSDEMDGALSEVIGHTNVALDGERSHVRTRETNLGDVVADAMREASGADIAMNNGGGIRTSIPIGDITRGQVLEVLPFSNNIVTKKITGADVIHILENTVAQYPAESGGFPQVSGIRFSIDPSKPVGSRVLNVQVDGRPINLKAKYVIAVNDFSAAGGDGLDVLREAETIGQYGSLEEAVMAYLKSHPGLQTKEDGRIQIIAQTESSATNVKIYTVQKGDCLWSIAQKLWGDGSKWTELYQSNPDTIANPNVIWPGMTLKIAA